MANRSAEKFPSGDCPRGEIMMNRTAEAMPPYKVTPFRVILLKVTLLKGGAIPSRGPQIRHV
jgi:hypothetical protein